MESPTQTLQKITGFCFLYFFLFSLFFFLFPSFVLANCKQFEPYGGIVAHLNPPYDDDPYDHLTGIGGVAVTPPDFFIPDINFTKQFHEKKMKVIGLVPGEAPPSMFLTYAKYGFDVLLVDEPILQVRHDKALANMTEGRALAKQYNPNILVGFVEPHYSDIDKLLSSLKKLRDQYPKKADYYRLDFVGLEHYNADGYHWGSSLAKLKKLKRDYGVAIHIWVYPLNLVYEYINDPEVDFVVLATIDGAWGSKWPRYWSGAINAVNQKKLQICDQLAGGGLDVISPNSIVGWARDPDSTGPVLVTMYANHQAIETFQANTYSIDLERMFGPLDANHAFYWTPNLSPGQYYIQATAHGVDRAGHYNNTYSELPTSVSRTITISASPSPSPTPPPSADPICQKYNLKKDARINLGDVTMLLKKWGSCTDCPEDFDGNKQVNLADLTKIFNNWGHNCQ